jgi:hypothetical protein
MVGGREVRTFSQTVKIGKRKNAWRVEDIRALVAEFSGVIMTDDQSRGARASVVPAFRELSTRHC